MDGNGLGGYYLLCPAGGLTVERYADVFTSEEV